MASTTAYILLWVVPTVAFTLSYAIFSAVWWFFTRWHQPKGGTVT